MGANIPSRTILDRKTTHVLGANFSVITFNCKVLSNTVNHEMVATSWSELEQCK